MKKVVLLLMVLFFTALTTIQGAQEGIVLYVYTSKQEPVVDAEFVLYGKGEVVQRGIKSDEEGLVLLRGLSSGNYQLRQISTMAGYAVSSENISFTYQAGQQLMLPDLINQEISGQVSLELVDAKGRAMPHEAFTLVHDGMEQVYQSDAQGTYLLKDLSIGDYQITAGSKTTSFSITIKNYQGMYELKVYTQKKEEDFPRKTPNHSTIYLFSAGTLVVILLLVLVMRKAKFMKWLHETDDTSA